MSQKRKGAQVILNCAEPKRILTIEDLRQFAESLSGKCEVEQSRYHEAMIMAVTGNSALDMETLSYKFLPDTPQWVRDLNDAMYHYEGGIFPARDKRYQAGKAALAKHFDVSFMP